MNSEAVNQLKPLKPLDDRPSPVRDHAKNGFSLHALEDLVSSCQTQPNWRPRADLAHAYYDMGKQYTHEQEREIRVEMGMEPGQTNLIHGVINGVLGQEAKSRTDVRIEADDDEYAEVSEVLSARMKEAQRESNSDMAVSNAYAGEVKGGIGWVEVGRANDPLDYPYRVKEIHRSQIWFDWEATDLGLDEARWQVRMRWEDADEAVALLPDFKGILMQSVNGWDLLNLPDDTQSQLYRSYHDERRTTLHRDEWMDTRRRRIKFFEVWYRVLAQVIVLHLGPTRRLVYDERNPLHVEAVSRNRVKVTKAITRQIRMALFAGPHRLIDVGTTRRKFPYVPFFGFRDDEDRSPYGLIEGMITPQDEYNEGRQQIRWMLKARQLLIDNDALSLEHNTIADIAAQVNRPDMVAVLNANRKNANGFRLGNDLAMQAQQIDFMQDAKLLIQEVPKVYSSQLGNAPAGVTSGIANSLLIEQGVIAMGELNDNYRFARKRVHEQLLDLIVEDHLEEEMKVMIGTGQTRRAVILNTWDPDTGAPKNRVKDAPVKVGLSDVPNSPAFRMQEQQQMSTIIQALAGNPQALALLAPAYIEGSSLSGRQQLADDLRRLSGLPTSGDRQGQQEQQALQQQQLMQAAQQQTELAQAEMADKKTKAAMNESNVRLNNARAAQIEHQIRMEGAQAQLIQQAASQQASEPAPPSEDELIQDALAEAQGA